MFFYYLKVVKVQIRLSDENYLTDCKFQKKFVSMFAEISEDDAILSKISGNQDILNIINGFSLPFSMSWYSVHMSCFRFSQLSKSIGFLLFCISKKDR